MSRLAGQRFCRNATSLSCASRTTFRAPCPAWFPRLYATKPAFEEADLAQLKVNGTRLMDTLHATCEMGKAHPYGEHHTETGMARLALNDEDAEVRRWLINEAKALGCKVTVDQMGNIFVVRPGLDNDKPPIMMGSHLDTQPTGGRYDGILGITAALEVLRTLHDADIQTRSPIGLINWTNEEGARFPETTLGSTVWADPKRLSSAWSMVEVPSLARTFKLRTVKEELRRTGFLGDVEASYEVQPVAAHFELHIEQGPNLEKEKRKIGVVTGGQAYRWYEIEFKGKGGHAGTTPFKARTDAMLVAAEFVTRLTKIAKERRGLATVGILHAQPGSINTIADTVKLTIDIRHEDNEQLQNIYSQMRSSCKNPSAKRPDVSRVDVSFRRLTSKDAVQFDPGCIAAIEQSASSATASLEGATGSKRLWRHMISGAGHDSCAVSQRAPAAMIFTPTKDGLSHTPVEYCSPEDCELGAQVLLGAVLRYDLKGGEALAKEAEHSQAVGPEKDAKRKMTLAKGTSNWTKAMSRAEARRKLVEAKWLAKGEESPYKG